MDRNLDQTEHQVFIKALNELISWYNRYGDMRQPDPVIKAIERVINSGPQSFDDLKPVSDAIGNLVIGVKDGYSLE